MYEKEYIWVKVNKDGKALKAFSTFKLAAAAEAKEIFNCDKKELIDTVLSFGYTLTSIHRALKDKDSLKEFKGKFISRMDEVDLESLGWQKITLNNYKEVF